MMKKNFSLDEHDVAAVYVLRGLGKEQSTRAIVQDAIGECYASILREIGRDRVITFGEPEGNKRFLGQVCHRSIREGFHNRAAARKPDMGQFVCSSESTMEKIMSIKEKFKLGSNKEAISYALRYDRAYKMPGFLSK